MKIVDRLKSSHSFLGDPLHREAWMEIEKLQGILEESNVIISRDKLDDIIMKLRDEIFFNLAQK